MTETQAWIRDDYGAKFSVAIPEGTPVLELRPHPTMEDWRLAEVDYEGARYVVPVQPDAHLRPLS